MFQARIDDELVLRLPEERDAPALLSLFERNRAYLTHWSDWPKRLTTRADCEAYVARYRLAHAEERSLPAALIYRGALVGLCELEVQDRRVVRKAELSYWLDEDHQGRGIVTRAGRRLLRHAFEVLELNRVFLRFKHAAPGDENARSRAVAERLGLREEGVQRGGGVARGRFMDMVVYSLLADEWRERARFVSPPRARSAHAHGQILPTDQVEETHLAGE